MREPRLSRDIQVQDVTMVFHGRGDSVIALERVDMHVPTGQFASIIGPSGCGKSTLLRLIADILQPHSGQVMLGSETPRAARHDHALGFVFQSPTLLPWRTVRQNVELPLDVVGRNSRRRSTRSTDELIELVGLKGFEEALPYQLSGGMQQRVAIARALVFRPALLLADEPTGSLDSSNTRDLMCHLRQMVDESQQTIVLVTHESAIAAFADRVIQLLDGRICYDGPPLPERSTHPGSAGTTQE
jgi:NitT/TauT family transport system ATP-binding protein